MSGPRCCCPPDMASTGYNPCCPKHGTEEQRRRWLLRGGEWAERGDLVGTHIEPPPQPNTNPAVWETVIEDMWARDNFGRAKYGTPLQAFNGRDPLVDAYQECLDLAVYLKQAILERSGR